MDDSELITAARSGDQDAFAELYRRHAGYVRAIGRSILRSRDLDDMCQETFLLAFMRLDSFAGDSLFRTWITRIAINRCLMILRKKRRTSNDESQVVHIDADEAVDRYVLASRDSQLESVGTRMDLERLLGTLKPLQRQILEMAYVDGIPDLQIAEVLGITVAAVRCTLYRARRLIRDAYKKS